MRLALPVLLALLPLRASGQECAPAAPDLYPADGSSGLPRDGVVRVVFHEIYEPQSPADEILTLFDDAAGVAVPGTVRVEPQGETDTRVELLTESPLEPSTQYRAAVQLPWGAGETSFTFRTGSVLQDASPPAFDGASEIRVVAADDVPCGATEGDDPESGYRVTVSFPPAADDAGPANMDYILYQTLGPELDLPVERKRVRAFGADPFGAVFLPEEAVDNERVCFVVHAVDMFGNVAGPEREACGDPVGPGQFRSMCTVGAGAMSGDTDGSAPASLLVVTAFLLARRKPGPAERSWQRRIASTAQEAVEKPS
ncbi:MAG: hypothetical protein HYY06_04645 [Deltaproteobacteria bacterium]|nr:hypothetical protein [Deltaproteobacteria bacterium]